MATTALIILDMLNTFEFPEGKKLLKHAKSMAGNIQKLKEKCKRKNIPVIYVNDNFGKWRSDWQNLYEICADKNCLGKDIAMKLKPESHDFFILKPKHSGFYATPLEILLTDLGIKRLILTGIAGNICVLFTAYEAHMRQFDIIIPKDCISSNSKKDNDYAMEQFKNVFKFKVGLSSNIKL